MWLQSLFLCYFIKVVCFAKLLKGEACMVPSISKLSSSLSQILQVPLGHFLGISVDLAFFMESISQVSCIPVEQIHWSFSLILVQLRHWKTTLVCERGQTEPQAYKLKHLFKLGQFYKVRSVILDMKQAVGSCTFRPILSPPPSPHPAAPSFLHKFSSICFSLSGFILLCAHC